MEAPTKRRREEAAGSMEEEDRISHLPEPILQNHILSLLTQNDAVRTSVLSKSWRHLGLTRPKFEFEGFIISESQERFISVVDNTLQRYVDQKLSIQEFILGIRGDDDPQNYKNSISLLDKWIPIVATNLGVKTFKLRACSFSLPSVVFQAEFLAELYLDGCKLDQIKNCIVNLQALKSLELYEIYVEEGTFEKIISSCPLIEHLDLVQCRGLSTTKVNKARNLKHLNFTNSGSFLRDESFEINDAPNLETIIISGTGDRYALHSNFFFPRLKSLVLWAVHLPTDLLKILSLNCPCLDVLELHLCPGLMRESKLSNPSITHLFIGTAYHEGPFEAVIDFPNMLHFEFASTFIPSISFATTSREWKSVIDVGSFWDPKADWRAYPLYLDPNAYVWPLKLHEFLKALSQSRISSLTIKHLPLMTNQDTYDGGSCDPVVVDRLSLEALYSSSEIPAFLNCLFRIFRPRTIALSLPTSIPNVDIAKVTKEIREKYDRQRKENECQLAESIWKILEKKGGTGQCNFWQQDLEKSSIHVLDKKKNAWHRIQDVCALSINQSICFLCCWNEKCMSEVGTKR